MSTDKMQEIFEKLNAAGRPEMDDDFPLIDEGDHQVIIDSAELKVSNAGHKMLQFVFKIVDGKHKDRLLWHHFNTEHPSEITKLRAAKDIWKLSDACFNKRNHLPKKRDEWLNKRLTVTIKHKARQEDGRAVLDDEGKPKMREEIKAYKPPQQVAPTVADSGFGTPPPTSGSSGEKMPWDEEDATT